MAEDEDDFILLSSVAIVCGYCLWLLFESFPEVAFYGSVVAAVAAANGA